MKQRDPFLDDLRALAILWVLWVHVLYWLGFFPEGPLAVAKSFFLLEMPLFFFLTGAGNALSTTVRSWPRYVFERWRRILVPYWCYGLLCLGLIALDSGGLSRAVLLSWVLPLDKQITSVRFLTGALWYIPVYMLCTAVLPLLMRLRRCPAVVPVLAVLVAVFDRVGWYYPQNVAFYAIWIWVGLQYPVLKERFFDTKKYRWQLWLAAAAGLAGLVIVYVGGLGTLDMQANKFPPNPVFMLYALAALSLLGLAAPLLVRVLERLRRIPTVSWGLTRLSRYSLTVFLYHPLVFLLLQPMEIALAAAGVPYSLIWLGSFAVLVILSLLLTVVFGRLEILGTRKKHERI